MGGRENGGALLDPENAAEVLRRQRGDIPDDAIQLTEQEAQREIANVVLFSFMDLLSVGGWLVVVLKDNSNGCLSHLLPWFSTNACWALLSMLFLSYYTFIQLRRHYQTKLSIAVTYAIESGYLVLTIWAWIVLATEKPSIQCNDEVSGVLELLVDMVILLYMRSLRLLAIVLFIILCGPIILVCMLRNRPRPTENPSDLIKNLNKVSVFELTRLRGMNYRHLTSSPQSKNGPNLAQSS